MAVLLDIQNAFKRYGEQVLLDDASATITDDGRVGFIGRNGAGKSTLLRIILGEEELDATSGSTIPSSQESQPSSFCSGTAASPIGSAARWPASSNSRARC